jgi:hypothetical protein
VGLGKILGDRRVPDEVKVWDLKKFWGLSRREELWGL